MANISSLFTYNSNFSQVNSDLKKLAREATAVNTLFNQLNKTAAGIKMSAASTFAGQAGAAGFHAQIVNLTGATEDFGKQLMRNKLTMREYFREAAVAYKKDSRARVLAEREVRRAQGLVVGMGDVAGTRKGVLLTPNTLDMKNAANRIAVLNKQYEIFNHLVNRGATELVNWGKNTQWAGRQLTVGLTVPMTIFATQALKAFAEVDKQITRFRKVYGSDLTGTVGDATEQMVGQIRALGAEFAKQYGIASAETMALAADLAATGLEGEKLAAAVTQTTRMMVLGEVDRQEAMKATLSIQTAFNQSSRELAQSIDFLNAVENQTSASLQDLTEAIPKTGPVIQALGGDIKDLAVLMTALREGGVSAGEGANAIKSGMASLIAPTKQAIDVARQFGIDLQGVVDRNKGQLMPMLLDFQDQLRGLDDFGKARIIEQIFGKYQFARISALFDNLNQQGSQTVGMIKILDASADELAKKSYSELKAQERAPSTRLAAARQQLQEQLIRVGADMAETLLPIMTDALNILQKVIDGFNNLPAPVKNFAKILAGVAAVSGPILMLAGIFGNLIGNTIKFGMSIINLFKRVTGAPVQQLQILTDQEMAAKLAADQLTGAYVRQKASVDSLNKSLQMYIASLKASAAVAPPGVVTPRTAPRPRRFNTGGIVYGRMRSGGQLDGYGGGDRIPALLEQGEFVINKESSRKFAPLLRQINDGRYGKFSNGLTGELQGYLEPDSKTTLSKVLNASRDDELLKYFLVESADMELVAKELGITLTDAMKNEISRLSGLDRSHFGRFENPVSFELPGVGRRDALGKEFLFTTLAEPSTYNQWINDMKSLSSQSKDDLVRLLNQINPNANYTVEQLSKVIANEGALSKSPEMRALLSDIRSGLANKNFTDSFLDILVGTDRRPNKVAKLLGSLSYSGKVQAAEAAGFTDKVLRKQLEFAARATLGESAYKRNLATVSPILDEITDIIKTGDKSQGALNRIAGLSSSYSGRNVLAGARAAMREQFFTEKGTFMSRKVARPQRAIKGTIGFEKSLFNIISTVLTRGRAKGMQYGGLVGMQGGGLIGGLMQILTRVEQAALPEATRLLQSGFNINTFKQRLASGKSSVALDKLSTQQIPAEELRLYVNALRKKQTGTVHDMMLHRGTSMDMKQFNSLNPGDIFDIPGTSSFSSSRGVAANFASMNRIGGEKRSVQAGKDLMEELGLGNVGAGNWITRHATTAQEEQIILRANRIQEARNYIAAKRKMAELEARRRQLSDDLYPSQRGTLFGKQIEPEPFEIAKRQRELDEIDRLIRNEKARVTQSIERGSSLRAQGRFLQDREPIIISVKTPRGTMTLPLTDIAGDKRFIEGMGVMSEAEHLLTNSRIRITGKSKDANGFNVLEGELIGTQKFRMGGPVLKYANGGKLPGYGGGDKVPAMLEPGEFVINKEATRNNLGLLAKINGGFGNTTGYGKFALGGLAGLKGRLQGMMPTGAVGKGVNVGLGLAGAAFIPSLVQSLMTNGFDPMTAISLAFSLVGVKQSLGVGGLNVAGAFRTGRVAAKVSKSGITNPDLAKRVAGKLGASQMGSSLIGKAVGGSALAKVATLGLRAIPVIGTIATIYQVANMIRDMKIDEWINQLKSVYGEATEMAKVYNIELKKTGAALKENEKQTRSMGLAAAITGRGQVEKDYAKAVSQQYGEAINRIKGLSTEQERANTLTEIYTSLLTQGFDVNQAKEITAEIARQAQATQEFNIAWTTTLSNIKNAEDAMGALVTSVQLTIDKLGTAEEKVTAFIGTFNNLLRQSADQPVQFAIQAENLINTQNMDPAALRTSIDQLLAQMGYKPGDIAFKAFENLDFATQAGRDSAALFMQSLALGIDPKKLSLPTVELKAVVRNAIISMEAKNELNNQLRTYMNEIDTQMEKTNANADKRIAALNKEKEAAANAHEARMNQLDAEAEALQDRADLINDNADMYIKALQKESAAEDYYNRQRQTGIDALSSLAKGDVFGFVQAQIQQASDAQQFGREQAIQQIEDTRDSALKGIDAQLKANQKAADAAGAGADARMEEIDKKIEKVNIQRSKALRGLQSLKDEAQRIIELEVGKVTSQDLQELENKATEVADIVPPKIKTALEAASVNLVEDFDAAIQAATQQLAEAYGLDPAAAQSLYAAVINGFTATFGRGATSRKVGVTGFGDLTMNVGPTGSNMTKYNKNPDTPPTTVDSSRYQVGKQYTFGGKRYMLNSRQGSYWWTGQDGKTIGIVQYKNKGGMILNLGRGAVVPGVGNKDTVPAMLTPGEFVVNKKATAQNLPLLQSLNSGGRVGYNMGGYVGSMPRLGFNMGGIVPSYNMPQMNGVSATSSYVSKSQVENTTLNMPVTINVSSNDPQAAANMVVKEFRKVQRSMENRYR